MDALPLPQDNLDAAGVASREAFPDNNNIFLASHLQKRYNTVSIPASYGRLNTSPAPGKVAGIVLGSVGGVVLILYLTFLALNPGGLARGGKSSSTIDEEVVVRSRRAPSRRSDNIEVFEERDRSRSYRRRPSRDRVVVEESMTGSSVTDRGNVIEVLEEESSAASSSTRPPRRPRSGVRTVDPYDYGGGSSYGGSRY